MSQTMPGLSAQAWLHGFPLCLQENPHLVPQQIHGGHYTLLWLRLWPLPCSVPRLQSLMACLVSLEVVQMFLNWSPYSISAWLTFFWLCSHSSQISKVTSLETSFLTCHSLLYFSVLFFLALISTRNSLIYLIIIHPSHLQWKTPEVS